MVQWIPQCFTPWVCLACAETPDLAEVAAGQSYLQSRQQMPSGEQWEHVQQWVLWAVEVQVT